MKRFKLLKRETEAGIPLRTKAHIQGIDDDLKSAKLCTSTEQVAANHTKNATMPSGLQLCNTACYAIDKSIQQQQTRHSKKGTAFIIDIELFHCKDKETFS